MFSPSKTLLFRPIAPLHMLKHLHQPLPLNPRESKQLLTLLTTSFRKHLDSEHGDFKADHGNASMGRGALPAEKPHRRRSLPDSWKVPTDSHLHSVLTNPLFAYKDSKSDLQSQKDPLHLFDLAVSRGMMNITSARAILEVKSLEIIRSSVRNVRDGMRESGAGLKVLKWLTSCGLANDLAFLQDERFAEILIQFMVAEGLQEVVWVWVGKSLKKLPDMRALQGKQLFQARRTITSPLMLLVKAESHGPTSLENAYLCLSRAAGLLQGFSSVEMRDILGPPGRYLAHQTISSNIGRPPVTESSFESFLSLVPVISANFDHYLAYLTLIHPTKPSPRLALNYLRNLSVPVTIRDPSITRSHAVVYKERTTIQLALDTAKFLLEHELYGDAEWVMGFLRTNYSGQLGLQQRRVLEQVKNEAGSLELLEALGIA